MSWIQKITFAPSYWRASHQKKHQKKQGFIVTISILRMQHSILAYAVKRGNEMDVFFIFIEEGCVVIENINKRLLNRISYQVWYKWCLKGKFGGSKSARGGKEIRARITAATTIFAIFVLLSTHSIQVHECSDFLRKLKICIEANKLDKPAWLHTYGWKI